MPDDDGKEPIFGIPDVDKRLWSALPKGWVGILHGEPGSGIELLAKQFAGTAKDRIPVYYYTTVERTEDITSAMRKFGWDRDVKIMNILEDYYDRVLSRNLEISRFRERGISPEEATSFTMKGVEGPRINFVTRMIYDLATYDRPFRLIVDSLDFFLEQADASDIISMVRQIRYRAQRVGGVAILTLTSGIHDARVMGTLESIADLLLKLEVEDRSKSFLYGLSIEKVRNHPEVTGKVGVDVGDHGIVSSGKSK